MRKEKSFGLPSYPGLEGSIKFLALGLNSAMFED
jgi:hypothetical protein